jgi:hypothetical protein
MFFLLSLSERSSLRLPRTITDSQMTADAAFQRCTQYIRNSIVLDDLVNYKAANARLHKEFGAATRRILQYQKDEFVMLVKKYSLVAEDLQTDELSNADNVFLRLRLCLERPKYTAIWDNEEMHLLQASFQKCLDFTRARQCRARTC